jgi:pSer/pThr/pTyr-binding forkhead associated (FHA) protein
MPSITISLDGVELKDIELSKPRTTLGRRTYNDIVMDNLAVSGEHAVLVLHADGVEILDLNSTNGTYVNGKAVVACRVQPDDLIEIGRYKIRLRPESPKFAPASAHPAQPRLKILNGPMAGKEMPLLKVVTTLGKPGVAVAAIAQHDDHHTIAMVEGENAPTVNGQVVGKNPRELKHQDMIVLAGTEMQFMAY